ncbi:uncharacterized protein [Oryza sativa Japonica Group]|uniref:Os02g0681100 protein n=3 Tax=Oryza sativa subsp. japonica TaxID=39947 RepID=Q6EPN2_ORYSJ|nr:uncharacterized protein LOC4330323 [Oryza sativa Japonica Group]KAB8088423.1 hypothetical protein EE612_013022 [Oryza sativa]KAF2946362.1 hypothetical protein DAI22_02g287800 [Oryza sativa Japonica Group]BAD29388.1 fringe-related protein-like [Oryza sativa Japonica Group]BAF09658.1 Os02g0681100 [Oryza sativa Japonica Group]BAG94666.1 unnamed protein product [Oryza sativa Japonica Group]|eukprot:NP_001047744.1 Os02g0681100 [Oryza sativa Japonica Group]
MKAAAATGGGGKETLAATLLRYLIILIVPFTVLYILYTLHAILSSTPSCPLDRPIVTSSVSLSQLSTTRNHTPSSSSLSTPPPAPVSMAATTLQHVVFGIAASARLWEKRKDYIKIWWRPNAGMRGFVWMDQPVRESGVPDGLPPIKISSNTSGFPYKNRRGHRSAIRISRIVSETFRLGLSGVRWYVMGDDDTVFLPDNLVAVLQKLDHRQPYYIGYPSESHLQNIFFSYGMAFGGGGFAISQPLAARLERMQDACIHRYPSLYGSDDRIHACMAELGVPLTRHPGFHQYDVYGDLLGLLAAHPVAPLVSLHHLDVVRPLFPNARSRPAALRRLFEGPVALDSAGAVQQSICYDARNRWTVSVSWGFVVMASRGMISAREMELPARTFLNWYKRADYKAHAFNTRPLARRPCEKPSFYYLSSARRTVARDGETTVTTYQRWRHRNDMRPPCRWKIADPDALLDTVVVLKKPDPGLWDRSPMRNCCRVLSSPKGQEGNKTMTIDVGVCKDWEFSQV